MVECRGAVASTDKELEGVSIELDSIVCGDFLEIGPTLPDSCVDLSINDIPYYKVKGEWWDRQWDTVDGYLEWLNMVCRQWHRLLKPNGSLYVFASPKMAARVELKLGEHFNVLSRITWSKPKVRFPHSQLNPKSVWRNYYPWAELVFFCEHYGADNAAKGESGYGAKCDELRGFVFESLRAYLDGERRRADISIGQIRDSLGFSGNMPYHWFAVGLVGGKKSQWQLPTVEHYQAMQELFNQQGRRPALPYEDYHDAPRSRFEKDHDEREYLRAEYEDLRAEYEDLRVEYEDLRAEYEDLRRPFNVTAQDQYTDVWEFPTVKAYPGKHPCEKPAELLEHIIRVSSRPGDLVADFFCGSGVTAEAAMKLGRRYFCCDIEEKWANFAKERVKTFQLSFCLDRKGDR